MITGIAFYHIFWFIEVFYNHLSFGLTIVVSCNRQFKSAIQSLEFLLSWRRLSAIAGVCLIRCYGYG